MIRHLAILAAACTLAADAHAQDVAAGEKAFVKCRPCHQVGETARNGAGPVLNGLFGRAAGTVPGFVYSPANRNSGVIWDEAVFSDYIRDPRAKMPGNRMAFVGIKDEAEIANLTAFLKQFGADGRKP